MRFCGTLRVKHFLVVEPVETLASSFFSAPKQSPACAELVEAPAPARVTQAVGTPFAKQGKNTYFQEYEHSHPGERTLHLFETPQLLIRHLAPSDTDAMFVIFSNPNVTKWMGDGTTLTRELCEKWITVSLHNYETKGFGVSAVIEKDTGVLIGCCGIVYDPERQEPEIIYAFHPNFWGKGYASELVPEMLRYGLDQCKLPYILATINSENTASQRIVEKAGMAFLSKESESDGSFTLVYRMEINKV